MYLYLWKQEELGQACSSAPLTLCGRDLTWVRSANHLGQELHESGLMEHDASVKKAQFINGNRESFSFASPVEVLAAFKVY